MNDFDFEIDTSEDKSDFWVVTLIIGLIAIIILSIVFGVVYYVAWEYPIERDVWGILDRAQVTAESEDMLELVKEVRVNLENKFGFFSNNPQTEGHCALIFKKPSNDLAAQYLIIKNIETRLERTNTFDKNSVEYQSAIDDIRGTRREIPYIDCWVWHFK